MTATILLQFAIAILWCVGLFAAIAGYGVLLLRLFGVRRPRPRARISLRLQRCNSPRWNPRSPPRHHGSRAVRIHRHWNLRTPRASFRGKPILDKARIHSPQAPFGVKLLFLIFAIVFAMRIAATVHITHYQQPDDYNFYLAAPEKMFQLHEYAPDPFSERHIMASIGGNYFLQTLVHAELPLEDVQMADRALGLLLLAVVAFGMAAEFELTSIQQAAFVVFVLITPQLQFNLTFVMLPSALFFGLVYLVAQSKLGDSMQSTPKHGDRLAGNDRAPIASTKSTYLPHGVLFVLCIAIIVA